MPDNPSPKLRERVYARAGGRCECRLRSCGHLGHCSSALRDDWILYRTNASAPYVLSNVIGLCHACHSSPSTYGARRQ